MSQKQLLIEVESFKPSTKVSGKNFLVSGIMQRAGQRNRNGRIYPKEILEKEVERYIEEFVKQNRALGELDHPEDAIVNLKNVSHNVVELHWEGDNLVGTVEILPTPNGNILRELFNSGINVGISSRAIGSLRKVDENTDVVNDDLKLVAFDFVSNPSTSGAFMAPSSSLNESIIDPLSNKLVKINSLIRDILSEFNS